MQYRTDWKQFLKYDENGRRSHEFPVYLVDTAPNEKQYLYHDEYTALVAAEKAAKDARRAAREAELAAGRAGAEQQSAQADSRPEANESRAPELGRRACPPWRGDPPSPPALLTGPPDIERHSRRCLICSHPDRDAIEAEFIRWRSPHKIARDYDVTDRNSIYRHAHATNLFEARRRQIGRVLESYLETIDDNPPADFDPVTRAVRVYAHLNANGAWVEPRRTVHILTSRVDAPCPDSDFDPDPNDDDPHGQPTHRLDDPQEFSQVPVGTTEGSPARECGENDTDMKSAASAAHTYGPAFRDRPSGERPQQTKFTGRQSRSLRPRTEESRFARGKISTKVAALGRESKSTQNTFAGPSLPTGGEEKANRDNPKIKNRHNRKKTKDIPKVNRDKNSTSPSPHFRPFKSRESRSARGKIPTKVLAVSRHSSLATSHWESGIINSFRRRIA